MKKRALFAACMGGVISSLLASLAFAETTTRSSELDTRIQRVRYNGDIVKVILAEGIVTTIELEKKEIIKDFAMGDREAWHAKHSGNIFMLKPKDMNGSTNLTIFTDKRAYLFELVMQKKKRPNVAYWLRVEYPEEIATTPEAIAVAKRREEIKNIAADFRAVPYQGKLNYDYWIVGPKELQPMAAHDNGQFTYLVFSATNSLPAPFILEADGSESLVDFHMERDTMVLHRVVEKIILRRGSLIAGITNKVNYRTGQSSPTGTASDNVERIVKGGELK